MTNEIKLESGVCDFYKKSTNVTYHSIQITGDRHKVKICGGYYEKAVRQLAEAGYVDFNDVGFPKPEVEVYVRELDRRDNEEYSGPLTNV